MPRAKRPPEEVLKKYRVELAMGRMTRAKIAKELGAHSSTVMGWLGLSRGPRGRPPGLGRSPSRSIRKPLPVRSTDRRRAEIEKRQRLEAEIQQLLSGGLSCDV